MGMRLHLLASPRSTARSYWLAVPLCWQAFQRAPTLEARMILLRLPRA